MKVSVSIGKENYRTSITAGKHTTIVDEPKEVGGTDLGPTPDQLLLSSLGACKAITGRMYADRKEWKLDKIIINLQIDKEHLKKEKETNITCEVTLIGDLQPEHRERLLSVIDRCPIHRKLTGPVKIESRLSS